MKLVLKKISDRARCWFTNIRVFAVLAVFSASFIGSFAPSAYAQTEPFVVADIRVEGLQRIAPAVCLQHCQSALAMWSTNSLFEASRATLYTGNFDDISVGRDGNVLVLTVAERPSISEITIEGNKAIETEALLDGLKGAGLAVGQVSSANPRGHARRIAQAVRYSGALRLLDRY